MALWQVLRSDSFADGAGAAAADVEYQLASAFHGVTRQLEIDAALEAVGGVRAKTQGACLAGNGRGGEECAFQEDAGAGRGHAAGYSPHDAGECQGATVAPGASLVGNQQGVV